MQQTANRLRKFAHSLIFWGLLILGVWLGYALSKFPKLDTVKLLGALGIAYQLLGIIVLSETISTSERLRRFVVDWFSGILLWGHSIVPMAVAFTSAWLVIAGLLGFAGEGAFPSASLLAPAAASFGFYSFVPGLFIDFFVFGSEGRKNRTAESRSRLFGAFLIFTGTAVQLIAAILDVLK